MVDYSSSHNLTRLLAISQFFDHILPDFIHRERFFEFVQRQLDVRGIDFVSCTSAGSAVVAISLSTALYFILKSQQSKAVKSVNV